MWQTLLIILMGPVGVLGALAASCFGIIRQQPGWLVAGASLSLGFAWYLTLSPTPLFYSLGYALPLLHLGGALAVRFRKSLLAWALLAPHTAIVIYFTTLAVYPGPR